MSRPAARQSPPAWPFRGIQNGVRQGIQPAQVGLVHELQKLGSADLVTADLGHQVALDQIGRPHILFDQPEQVVVGLPGAEELHDRDINALFKHLAGVGAQHPAADIDRMTGVGKQGDRPAAAKDRGHHGKVVEVAGGQPRIVADQAVAVFELRPRVVAQKVTHGQRHGVDMARRAGDGLGDHIAPSVKHPGRQVAGLADHGGKRGVLESRGLFVDNRDQAVPQNL